MKKLEAEIQEEKSSLSRVNRDRQHLNRTELELVSTIRNFTARLTDADEDSERVSGRIRKLASQTEIAKTNVSYLDQDIKEEASKLISIRRDMADQLEKLNPVSARISELQSELARVRTERTSVKNDVESTLMEVARNQDLLGQSVMARKIFLEFADEIEIARDALTETERELARVRGLGIEGEIRQIDLSEVRNAVREALHELKAALAREDASSDRLRDEIADLTSFLRSKSPEKASIGRRIKDSLTFTTSLTDGSPRVLSSHALKAEIQGRHERRSRNLDALKSIVFTLSERADDAITRINAKKAKLSQQALLLQQRLDISQRFRRDTGVTEEMVLGFNSINDFARDLNDELPGWRIVDLSVRARVRLGRWETKLDLLFETLDHYYMRQ
jgi:predicted  nucleic acid-binding Zn-ribbon protein